MRNLISWKWAALAILAAVMLSGCGGTTVTIGGPVCGYDLWGNPIFCQVYPPLAPLPTPVASTSTFALAQGLQNAASSTYSFTLHAQDTYGNLYTVQYSSAPGAATTFQATAASTSAVNQTFFENGYTTANYFWTNYFIAAPYQYLGSIANYAGGSEVVNTWTAPPATATVGQQFPSLTATLYRDSTNSVVDGTLTETVGLAANTATTALLCVTDTVQLTQNGIYDNLYAGTTSNCYVINTSGAIQGMQITAPVGNGTLLFY